MKRFILGIALATVVSLASVQVYAQGQPTGAAPASEPAGGAKDPNAAQEAAARYGRGVELFKEGDYRAALIEFSRAYELAPNYAVLYNMGQVYYQLQDYANALVMLERYLYEGGEQIDPDRRTRVQEDVARLRPRVAKLSITVSQPDAEVLIDDVAVGRSPLQEPVAVSGGRRKVTVIKEGQPPQSKYVDVAGGDTGAVHFDLAVAAPPPPGPGPAPPPPPRRKPKESEVPWAGWAVTGGLTAAAVVAGLLALNASGNVEEERGRKTSQEELESAADTALGMGIATDVLAGAAIVAGVISLVLTVTAGGEEEEGGDELAELPVDIGAGPGGVVITGHF